jgi:F0F1-type ATP synthase assembly protein I
MDTPADRNNKKQSDNEKAWWQPALVIFARSLGWIVAPVIFGSYLGRWLDKKYGTEPWLFISTVGFAFFISMFGLIKETAEQYKKIEKDSRKKNDENNIGNNQ